MANKPQIVATFRRGKSIGAVDNFVDTMNWLVGFVSNLKSDTGIEIQNQTSDHPTIKAKIVAGTGIKVEESNGAWKISTTDSDDDSSGYKKRGSGGSGSGGSSGHGGSGGGGGGGGSGTGTGIGSGGGGGGSSSSTGTGTSTTGRGSNDCNQYSDDIDNPTDDMGMSNIGDLCAELNGW